MVERTDEDKPSFGIVLEMDPSEWVHWKMDDLMDVESIIEFGEFMRGLTDPAVDAFRKFIRDKMEDEQV